MSDQTFRVHFHDGTSHDYPAPSSLFAERDARLQFPALFIKKIKLVRETTTEEPNEITRPAVQAVSGGEPSEQRPDAGGAKMDGSRHPGRADDQSDQAHAKSEQATKTSTSGDADPAYRQVMRELKPLREAIQGAVANASSGGDHG